MKSSILKLCYQIELFYKLAADPIATNKTEMTSLPSEDYYNPSDIEDSLEEYRRKTRALYYQDIRKAHFDKKVVNFTNILRDELRNKLKKELKAQGLPQKEIDRTIHRTLLEKAPEIDRIARTKAEEKVNELVQKQSDKSYGSHSTFIEKLRELGVKPGEKILAPGSGMGDEQVFGKDLDWHGLEYQQNLVDLSTQRNKQLGLPSITEQWSFLKVDPESKLGENWEEKINTFTDKSGNATAIYAKHACGGLTDGALYRAIQMKIPRMLLATCCANRYPEVSWRVLSPTKEDGTPMTFPEYNFIADKSKTQGEVGDNYINLIDSFREKLLKDNGYKVERGRTSYGPYIKAWL